MWDYGYGGMMGYGDFGVLHLLSSIFWAVLFIVIIVTAVRWLRQGKGGWHCSHCDSGNALELLKERYAKGEISKEEFEEKKKVLSA